MGLEKDYPGHPDLTGGGETALHSHAGGAGGVSLTVAETEVFNGISPTTWTVLNLSGTIGSNPALVILKICVATGVTAVAVRKNGDTDEFFSTVTTYGTGAALSKALAGIHTVLVVTTDNTGKIEWKTNLASSSTIDIIAYIK